VHNCICLCVSTFGKCNKYIPHRFGVPGVSDEVLGRPDILQDDVRLRVPQGVEVVLHLHADPVDHLSKHQQMKGDECVCSVGKYTKN
jgi:hypothetical protein